MTQDCIDPHKWQYSYIERVLTENIPLKSKQCVNRIRAPKTTNFLSIDVYCINFKGEIVFKHSSSS